MQGCAILWMMPCLILAVGKHEARRLGGCAHGQTTVVSLQPNLCQNPSSLELALAIQRAVVGGFRNGLGQDGIKYRSGQRRIDIFEFLGFGVKVRLWPGNPNQTDFKRKLRSARLLYCRKIIDR